jgi:peptide/nickel transport system substrate-binding protein
MSTNELKNRGDAFHALLRGQTRRTFIQLAAGVGALSVFSPAFATESPKRGGTLRFAVSDAVTKERLDPMFSVNLNDCVYCTHIFDKLVKLDDEWNVIPMLATAWQANTDSTEWTFKLRQGVTFHDGSAFDAEDVTYSVKRHLDKANGSSLFARLSGSLDADGILMPDKETVLFRLKRPDSTFPVALGQRQMAIVKRGATDFTVGNTFGTGPFKLESWSPGESWSLVRNQSYWSDKGPYLDKIQAVVISEQTTKVESVLSGQYQLGDSIDVSAAAQIQASGKAVVLGHKAALSYVIMLDSTQKPFDDARVTKAIKIAQERAHILQAALQGYGSITGDIPIDPASGYYPHEFGVPAQNIEKAKSLLAEAGYPNGIDITVDTSAVDPGMLNVAIAFKEVVAAAGIRVELKQWPADVYWNQPYTKTPSYTDYWTYRHPLEAAKLFYTSDAPWNYSKIKDPEFDKLIDKGLATSDPAEQRTVVAKAYARMAESAGTAIPTLGSRLWVHGPGLHGLEPSRTNYMYLTEAWLSA